MGPSKTFKRRKRVVLKKKVDLGQNFLSASTTSSALFSLQPQQPNQTGDWWDGFSKRITGPLCGSKNSRKFESIFKMTRKTFDYICSLVRDDLSAKQSNFTCTSGPLSADDQVAIALRRLSSGESLANVGNSFGINQSAVSQITWRLVETLEARGLKHLQWPSSESEIREIKSKFEKLHGLPNCVGVIDIMHILMTLPAVDGSHAVWIDREKNHSMILQAIVDARGRFLDVNIGYPGSLSDELVLQNSAFFRLCEDGKRLNGKKELVDRVDLREYIIGDSGFPLLSWLLPPYRHPQPNHQAEFNKHHLSTQKAAQDALARMKEMWRVIRGVMWLPDLSRLPRIIFTCCLLHNILIDMEDAVFNEMSFSHDHDSSYRQQVCETVTEMGAATRDNVALHLTGKLQA